MVLEIVRSFAGIFPPLDIILMVRDGGSQVLIAGNNGILFYKKSI